MNDIVKSQSNISGIKCEIYTRETYCLFIIINLSINFLSVLKVQVFKKKKKKRLESIFDNNLRVSNPKRNFFIRINDTDFSRNFLFLYI